MEQIPYLIEFSFFVIFALLGTVISMKLRQPYVVGLLIFGMIAGPNMLGLVRSQGLISAFSSLGAILLLFMVGIEFSISRILKSGFRAVIITVLKMGALFFIGYEIALLFGLDVSISLFIGAMASITSTALLFKIITEKKMANNAVVPLLFSMLIVEDIFAVAALTFFSSFAGQASNYENTAYSLLISLGLLGIFYAVVRRPLANAVLRLTSNLNPDVMILVSFSVCLLLSMAAGLAGLSPAIGAFLAGSIIATLPNSRAIEKTIKPLLLLFASLFFLSLGMQISLGALFGDIALAIALVAAFVAVCFGSVFILLYMTGTSAKNSLFGASSMVVMGEFSLIIASVAGGGSAPFLIAVGSFGVVVTAIISSFLLDRQERLLQTGYEHTTPGITRATRSLSAYFTGLIHDFSPNGSVWKASLECWRKIRKKIGAIAAVAAFLAVARIAINISGTPADAAYTMKIAVFVLGAVPLLYFLAGALSDVKPVLDSLAGTIARHKKSAKTEKVVLFDLFAAIALITGAIAMPALTGYFLLPPFFGFVDKIFILFAFAFIWDIARKSAVFEKMGFAERKKTPAGTIREYEKSLRARVAARVRSYRERKRVFH